MTGRGDQPGAPSSVDVEIEDGRTTIAVSGGTEAAVVVRSSAGEQVYLPPEREDPPSAPSPYTPAGGTESPYDGIPDAVVPDDSPYAGIPDDTPYRSGQFPDEVGLTRTANGFRIVHPEPVTDVRFLR